MLFFFIGKEAAAVVAAPAAAVSTAGGGGRVGRSVSGGRDPRWLLSKAGKGDPRFERLAREAVQEALRQLGPATDQEAPQTHATQAEIQKVAYRLFTTPVLAPLQDVAQARGYLVEALEAYDGSTLRAFLAAQEAAEEEAAIGAILMLV